MLKLFMTLSLIFVPIPAFAALQITDSTPLSSLGNGVVIEVAERIPVTRGAFRQIYKEGRRQAGEYHFNDGVSQNFENLPRWKETCEIIFHVTHRPVRILPKTRFNLANAKTVQGENGGVFLIFGQNDRLQAIRCVGAASKKDEELTVGDLKRAFGGRVTIVL